MNPTSQPTATAGDLPRRAHNAELVLSAVIPAAPPRVPAPQTRIVRSLADRFRIGRFASSVAVLAGGTALGQAVVIAASPILARLYSPEDFGLLGVYASLLGILAVVATLRYEFAIPLAERDEDAAALVLLSLAIIPFTGAAVGLAVWAFRGEIAAWTNSPALAPYLWLLPVGVALMGIYQVFTYWALRKKAFGRIASTKLHQGIAATGAQLLLFPLGPLGLLLGNILGNAAGSSSLAAPAAAQDRLAFLAADLRDVARMAARYRRFPQVSTISGVVNASGLLLPTLLLAACFGPLVAGQFALVQRIIAWPMNLLGGAVAQVYFGEGAAARRTSSPALWTLFLRASSRLAMVAVAPLLVLFAAGPWLIPLVFGRDWELAGQFARLLAPMVAVQLVVSPLSQTLNVLERQSWQLGWDLFRFALVLASFAAASHFDFSPVKAVGAYASVMFLSYLVLWALLLAGISSSNSNSPRTRQATK